jgi:adenosine kinase
MKILVTGSIAYDLLLRYDGSFISAIDPAHLDDLAMSFVTPQYERHHGGTAANIAWTLKLLNQDPLLAATVGDDGGAYTLILKNHGIDISHIEQLLDRATSTAIIATDNTEHQITFYHPGADHHGHWPDLSKEKSQIAIAIIAPRDVRMMTEAARWCRKNGVPYLFDPGQQIIALPEKELREAIQSSRGVIANAYEWNLLSEKLSVSTDDILKMTPLLIVTHAEEGLTLYTRDEVLVVPAFKVDKVVNPTGAGDALRAGILTGLAGGWSLLQSARLGSIVASFVVEQEGTLLDQLDLNKVLGRADVTYGEPLPHLP